MYLRTSAFALEPSSCLCDCFSSKKDHCRLSVRDTEGGGIGYDQGYATFEGFLAPHPHPESLMPFLDLQGHVFKNGYIAANTGVGIRGIIGSRIYGFNSYYDFRDTKNIHYTQTGLGFETLGQSWDFRVNGYLPIGKKRVPLEAEVEFENHPLAMKGVDAEIGFHCPFLKRFGLYAAMSPYYYTSKIESPTWGAKARLKGELGPYITFEASHSYDHTFHNNFQLQLTFTLPLEGKSHKSTRVYHENCLEALRVKMVQLVVREEIIVAKDKEEKPIANELETP